MCDAKGDYEILKRFQKRLMNEFGEHPMFHDEDFTRKLRRIDEMLDVLKRKLAVEKRHLTKERWETQSLCSISGPAYAFHPYPSVDWTRYLITPNYDYEYYGEPTAQHLTLAQLHRGHLENVERMCDAELVNLQTSMMNLRKLRKEWNCHELNAPMVSERKKKKKRRTYHNCSDDDYHHHQSSHQYRM